MGSIKMTPENDENPSKLLTPCWFFAIQVSEIVFPKSGGENWQFQCFIFMLYVCSETHNCKMSQKSAGPHFENCAFRVGRIAKTEKCKKWSSKISFDKKQPKQATTKNQASANQRKTAFHCNFTAKTERHFEGFVRPREPWRAKKRKKRFAPYAKMCFPCSMGAKIMMKIALKRLRCRQRTSLSDTSSVLTLFSSWV